MTKLPAGDTGRHVYRCAGCDAQEGEVHRDGCQYLNEAMDARAWRKAEAPIDDSILWDRLRADLANLGAAYGEMPEIREQDREPAQSFGVTVEVCNHCLGTGGWHTWSCENGPHPASLYPDKPTTAQLSEPDRNLYYDGIILAARKKREAHYDTFDRPLFSKREAMREAAEAPGRTLSKAIARPLDWEPRVGHRGVPSDAD